MTHFWVFLEQFPSYVVPQGQSTLVESFWSKPFDKCLSVKLFWKYYPPSSSHLLSDAGLLVSSHQELLQGTTTLPHETRYSLYRQNPLALDWYAKEMRPLGTLAVSTAQGKVMLFNPVDFLMYPWLSKHPNQHRKHPKPPTIQLTTLLDSFEAIFNLSFGKDNDLLACASSRTVPFHSLMPAAVPWLGKDSIPRCCGQ